MSECKSDCCDDKDCPCVKVCSDERLCEIHYKNQLVDYWYLRSVPMVWVRS